MGEACMAEQMFFDRLPQSETGRRLSLVERRRAAGADAGESLADYVWALAPGDTCFACGKGELEAGESGLTCPVCGAEAGALQAA